MILSRRAERTSRIGLGPGVLVPSLRHPMVNAAAIAELVDQAPGRVVVAVGSGFTGRMALGERPMSWRKVAEYLRCLKALLAGETAEWVAELIPFVSSMALTGTAEQIPEKIAGLAALGVTEIVYQPAGSDIERDSEYSRPPPASKSERACSTAHAETLEPRRHSGHQFDSASWQLKVGRQ